MRVRALHRERQDRSLLRRCSDNPQRVDRRQTLMRVGAEGLLVRTDAQSPDSLHIIQRGGKADRLDDGWRPRLEAVRRVIVSHCLPSDFLDHLAAAHEWRQRLEHFALAVKNTNSRGSVDLVTGKDIKVCIEISNIN